MSAADAQPFPLYGVAYRVYFAIVDTSGALVTGGLTGLAATISLDGAAHAATTNAPVEIGTSGTGYLDLTAAELTANGVLVIITVTNVTAVARVVLLLPQTAANRTLQGEAFATALLDLADGVETAWTLRQTLRILGAYAGGTVSGADTNQPIFLALTAAAARITAQVDNSGNRTVVVLTPDA